jgi:hypothetical protein
VLVAHACNPSYSGVRNQEDRRSKPALGKQFARPYLENTQQNRADGVTQVVECLPSKCEALSSYPLQPERERERERERDLSQVSKKDSGWKDQFGQRFGENKLSTKGIHLVRSKVSGGMMGCKEHPEVMNKVVNSGS